jgi:hypothetical protein
MVEQVEATLAMYGDDRAVGQALIAQGEAALPALEEAVARGDTRFGSRLIYWVAGIPGDNATSLLVKIMGESSDPDLVRSAIACIDNREVRRELTAQEKSVLIEAVRHGHSGMAYSAAPVLGHCLHVPPAERVPPILERYVEEIQIPPRPNEYWGHAYLSPYVLRLNAYLRALSYVGGPAIPYVRQAAEDAGTPQVRKWLTIARGMAGDGDVAPDIERIIRGDPDMSTRAEAARAYARSAKEAAIRLLVELLDDPAELPSPTVSPLVPRIPGERPVATVAASELTKLGHHDLVLSHRQSAGSQGTQTAPGG